MKSIRLAVLGAALLAVPCLAAEPERRPEVDEVRPESTERPRIQIALLLDTSSSMDGLINQAKTQLWKIVSSFSTARREGKRPTLEIALYEYGKSSLSPEGGYIRQIVPLTTDLDRVSEELFALTTHGGDEFCGMVIKKAVEQLEWSRNKKDLKLIYIAGNEPFTQGPVSYREAVGVALERGITVNTIHCGPEGQGVSGKWKHGALLADGHFMVIDHNQAIAQIDAPQDKELARLGAELNKTYIGFGARGRAGAARQERQDANAMAAAPASASLRAVSKASSYYDASDWDLVDAVKKGKVEVSAVAPEALPAEMKDLNAEERAAFVDQKEKEREEIQKKIQQLSDERKKFVAAEMKKRGDRQQGSLDDAMIQSARALGAKHAFTF